MNKEGLVAAITAIVKEPEDNTKTELFDNLEEHLDDSYDLPPDLALLGHSSADLKMLDKALCGPNVKEWQEALNYEINQLERLRTWVLEDLSPGQTAIPCNAVICVQQGSDSEVQGYRVRIVASGHKQVEGIN